MAYKISKGGRSFGDIVFEEDSDTGIDFEPDTVKLDTGGATRLTVENTVITTTVPIHINGTQTEGLRIGKGGSDYREIQFETDGVDTAFIQVDSSEGLVIGCQSDNDEIIFKTKAGGGDLAEVARMTSGGRLGVGSTTPSHKLDINGDIRIRGNDIRDNSGNPAISFDGSANTEIVGSLVVNGGVYKKVRDVGVNDDIENDDYILRCIQNASITLTLPSKSNNSGQIVIVKDMMGNAGSPNNKTITIAGYSNGGSNDTIDGQTNYVINTNKGSVTLVCDGINGWMIIGRYTG